MSEILMYQVYFENFLFFIFSSVLIISGLLMISVKNSVYSILFLVINFATAACILFLLECEFISLLFLIIYVGAIAVLFLFVIMMLDIKIIESPKDILKYLPIGSVLGGFFILEVFFMLKNSLNINPYNFNEVGDKLSNFYVNWYGMTDNITDIKALGQVLYTHYILQLLITGLILLLAVIGAVVLTMTNSSIKLKKQVLFKQVSRNYKNILLI